MSETDTYYKYRSDRVLIETARMYRPMFAPATVYLTGAQVEMLRNMTQYLNRPNTYVEEYEPHKYKTPKAAQFDGIQKIVADLEEKLMGNPNTIWGYTDRYAVAQQDTSDVNGSYIINMPGPDSGEVWRVMGVCVYRSVNVNQLARLQIITPAGAVAIEDIAIPALSSFFPSISEFVLNDTDNLRATYASSTIGELVITTAWGYKMVIP